MPLRWSQVAKRLDPASHTIKTAPKRMKRSGDPLLPVLTESTDVAAALRQLAEQLI
jgi:DNA primase